MGIENRNELAKVMRKRQLSLLDEGRGLDIPNAREHIKNMEDNELIRCYITCAKCGEQQVSLEEVDKILENSPPNFEAFMNQVHHEARSHN